MTPIPILPLIRIFGCVFGARAAGAGQAESLQTKHVVFRSSSWLNQKTCFFLRNGRVFELKRFLNSNSRCSMSNDLFSMKKRIESAYQTPAYPGFTPGPSLQQDVAGLFIYWVLEEDI